MTLNESLESHERKTFKIKNIVEREEHKMNLKTQCECVPRYRQ